MSCYPDEMKTKFCVWAIGVMLLLFPPIFIHAQSYHLLNTRDFTGTPPADRYYVAYTNCYVSYSYQATRHNGSYNIDFNVQLLINNNKSWIRLDEVKKPAMLQDILKHEQGHYNIAYLMKNELYSVFTHHQYTSNYQYEIALLFKAVDTKYHKLNDDYESQTQHMDDVKNQAKWNAWFSKALSDSEIADNGAQRQ